MKLDEILTERVHISVKEHDAIRKVFDKWIDGLREQYADQMHDISDIIFFDYEKLVKPLQRSLLPTVRNIIKQYFPTGAKLEKYFEMNRRKYEKLGWKPSDFTIDTFLGHMLRIDVHGSDSHIRGAISNVWDFTDVGKRGEKMYKLHNKLLLTIPTRQLEAAIRHKNTGNIEQWVATTAHEITHLIQTLKSATQTLGRAERSINPEDGRSMYLSQPAEIDAFAQSVASKILQHAQQRAEPLVVIDAALQGIRIGIRTMFRQPLFQGEEYDEYKEFFTKPTSDEKLKAQRQLVWRKFQKALVAKLMKYREQLA